MDTLNGLVLELNGDTAETSQPILNTPNLQQKKRWMNTLCEKHILNGPHAQLVRSVWTKKNKTERKASAQDEKQSKKNAAQLHFLFVSFFTWTQDLLMSPFVIIFNNGFTSLEKWKFNEADLSLCFHKEALISD